MMPTRKVGLMGGTFDPIHYGHLFIAEEARVRFELERVLFVPNNEPAHAEGKAACAGPEDRARLTELGIASNPAFEMSRVELDRSGKSFAFDTVQALRQQLGAATELFFIVGADSLRDVLTWYRGQELLALCQFIAASRPGFDLEAAWGALPVPLRNRVHLMRVPGLHIASRELRARVAGGAPIRYLTPDSVCEHIERHHLYQA